MINILADEKIKLHIGGKQQKEGWKILNKIEAPYVDFYKDLNDLSDFPNECCSSIYASHVVEHINQRNMPSVLKELKRILAPAGVLMISVPDMDVLCELFLDPDLDYNAKYQVMRMMFGGQVDEFDFHYIGLNYPILSNFLKNAGFAQVIRVANFDIFKDTSSATPYKNKNISLNLMAMNL